LKANVAADSAARNTPSTRQPFVMFRRAGDPGLDPGERPARQLL
jgi:hypothetical protein